jgi:hypothetical protein
MRLVLRYLVWVKMFTSVYEPVIALFFVGKHALDLTTEAQRRRGLTEVEMNCFGLGIVSSSLCLCVSVVNV